MNTVTIAASSVHCGTRRGTLSSMRFRLGFLLLAVLFLSACDGYIEELRVQADGTVEFAAQAIVVCTDPLQQEIWDGDPCEQIDTAIRSGEVGDLPFDYQLDPNRVSLVGTGEADRRTVDVSWSGTVEEMSSLLAGAGRVTALNDEEFEVVFSSRDTPFDALSESTDPDIVRELSDSRWNPGEFRINSPDLVIDHNGDEIQGRIVIWNIDGDEPDEFRIVFTTADPPLRWWWWVTGSVLLFGVLAMMITLEGKPKKSGSQKTEQAKID